MAVKRPPDSIVGARLRLKATHQQEVEDLCRGASVAPIYKEMRADGNVSYWLGKDQVGELESTAILERILLGHRAHYPVIGSATKH